MSDQDRTQPYIGTKERRLSPVERSVPRWNRPISIIADYSTPPQSGQYSFGRFATTAFARDSPPGAPARLASLHRMYDLGRTSRREALQDAFRIPCGPGPGVKPGLTWRRTYCPYSPSSVSLSPRSEQGTVPHSSKESMQNQVSALIWAPWERRFSIGAAVSKVTLPGPPHVRLSASGNAICRRRADPETDLDGLPVPSIPSSGVQYMDRLYVATTQQHTDHLSGPILRFPHCTGWVWRK